MTPRISNALSIALFGLLAMVFVQGAPITGDTVGAVDVTTRRTSPYLEDVPVFQSAEVPLQTDQTDGIALAATFWRDVQRGSLRMWEPNLGTGAPLGGVLYTRVWSPFYWVGAIVPAPVLSSYAVWLALWTAQTGAWLLARRLGVGRLGATFAGVAYGFSGPVTALLLRINEASLAPWVLLAVHGVVSGPSRRGRLAVSGLALAVAMTWLGGFPAGTVFVLYAAGTVAVATALRESGRDAWKVVRRLSRALAGVALGTALAAPLLLPSYEFLAQSESLERAFGSDDAAGLEMFGTAVSGRLLGTYQGKDWWWPDPGYSNPVAASATIGAVALCLMVVAGVSRRLPPDVRAARTIGRVYLPLGAVVLAGTFLGGPVLAALQVLPFLGSNQFGRSRFLLALVVALAAGCVLDGLLRRRHPDPDAAAASTRIDPWFRGLSLGMVLLALVGAGLVAVRAIQLDAQAAAGPEPADVAVYRVERLLDGLLVPGLALVVAILMASVLARAAMGPRNSAALASILILTLAAELQWGAWGFTPVIRAEEGFYPSHESFEVMEPEVFEGQWRFAGTSLNVVRPNSAAWLRMADLRISNPSHVRYRELMRAADPDVFAQARLRTWFTDDLDPSSEVLDRSSVRYLVAPAEAGVLEARTAESVEATDDLLSLRADPQPVRGLRFVFDRPGCPEGSLTIRNEGAVVGQRPLWQLAGEPFDVAVADVEGPANLAVEIEGCDLVLAGEVTVLRARSDSELVSLWAEDAVIYERAEPRPRVEVATAVEGVDDRAARLEALTDDEDLDVVILDDPLPRRDLGGGSAVIATDRGDRLRVEVNAAAPGHLVVRDALASGWRATVNGSPVDILHADHAYRAVAVPGGESIVEMTYFPRSRMFGIVLAVVAAAWVAWSVVTARRRAHPGDDPAQRNSES